MYLIDTNILREYRKATRCDHGVQTFFKQVIADSIPVFISVITVGELRRGIELIRHRADNRQADQLEAWLISILDHYQNYILKVDDDIAQLWGKLRVPHYENALDKLIAATALIHDLTLVTRNNKDFSETGVKLLNPFKQKIKQ